MDSKKIIRVGILLLLLLVSLFTLLQADTNQAFAAALLQTGEFQCNATFGGVWVGSDPNEVGPNCYVQDAYGCTGGDYAVLNFIALGNFTVAKGCHTLPSAPAPAAAPGPNYGMERKGICKLVSIDDAFLGGMVTATVHGSPNHLKLKADGKTYTLPVVPGSVVANGDGAYTAQFYTIDPESGQALVPAGDYTVRCHGGGGSKDGGSENTVSIGY